jgi:hypothetical protein
LALSRPDGPHIRRQRFRIGSGSAGPLRGATLAQWRNILRSRSTVLIDDSPQALCEPLELSRASVQSLPHERLSLVFGVSRIATGLRLARLHHQGEIAVGELNGNEALHR